MAGSVPPPAAAVARHKWEQTKFERDGCYLQATHAAALTASQVGGSRRTSRWQARAMPPKPSKCLSLRQPSSLAAMVAATHVDVSAQRTRSAEGRESGRRSPQNSDLRARTGGVEKKGEACRQSARAAQKSKLGPNDGTGVLWVSLNPGPRRMVSLPPVQGRQMREGPGRAGNEAAKQPALTVRPPRSCTRLYTPTKSRAMASNGVRRPAAHCKGSAR